MNTRERRFLVIFLALAGVVCGGIIAQQWFLKPLSEANAKIADLESDISQKEQLIRFVKTEQKRLEKYKALSLPSNPDQAASDYTKYLLPLLRSCGLTVDVLQGPQPGSLKPVVTQGKKPGHQPLLFTVSARGSIPAVVKTLSTLKHAPIAHRVKNLALSPIEASAKDAGKLNMQMTLEALIVNKSDNVHPLLTAPDTRLVMIETVSALRRAPVGLALGPWMATKESLKAMTAQDESLARNYIDIFKRNPFLGAQLPPEPEPAPTEEFDVREHVRLSHTDPVAGEAYLRNLIYRGREVRLKSKKGSGYDIFRIINEETERVVVRGKVLRVDQRDVYFQVAEDIYGLHIGQSLAEAMRKPLYPDETEALQLDPLYDEAWAAQEMKQKPATPQKKGFDLKGKDKGGFFKKKSNKM
jgi:hypothetical protein